MFSPKEEGHHRGGLPFELSFVAGNSNNHICPIAQFMGKRRTILRRATNIDLIRGRSV